MMMILFILMYCVDCMKFCFKDFEDIKRWVLYLRFVYNLRFLLYIMMIVIFVIFVMFVGGKRGNV